MQTTGLFGSAFWLRLGYAAILVGIPLLLGLVLVWRTTRGRAAAAASQLRRARIARLIGLGIGALVGVLTVFAAQAFLAPIAVVAGYLVGVHHGELRDTPTPTGTVRVASLRPRTVRQYIPRWAMLVALVAAALTLFAPAILAAVPTPTYGPWHPIPDDPRITLPGAALRWPSPLEWLPLAVVAGGALLVGVLLIQRVLRLPADQSDQRESTRRNAVRTITGAIAGIELVTLGALTLFASAGLAVPSPVGGTAYLGSRILVWTGLGLAATGIAVWLTLSTWRRGRFVPATLPPS
jgi:hypothetical protein